MNKMKYRGYIARIEFDEVDRIFVGHLAGIKDIVGFHGTTVDELENAFRESVDHYIAISEQQGRPAQKPYSFGKVDAARFTRGPRRRCHCGRDPGPEHQSVGFRGTGEGCVAELSVRAGGYPSRGGRAGIRSHRG